MVNVPNGLRPVWTDMEKGVKATQRDGPEAGSVAHRRKS